MADRSPLSRRPEGEKGPAFTTRFLLSVSCCWELSPLSGPRDRPENRRTVSTQVTAPGVHVETKGEITKEITIAPYRPL